MKNTRPTARDTSPGEVHRTASLIGGGRVDRGRLARFEVVSRVTAASATAEVPFAAWSARRIRSAVQ